MSGTRLSCVGSSLIVVFALTLAPVVLAPGVEACTIDGRGKGITCEPAKEGE